jgi:transcriptional regulator
MYNPPLFREQNREILHQLIRKARLATLVCNGSDGLPEVSHLPLLLDAGDGENGSLLGHFARANLHWKTLSTNPETIAIFMGPDAYVSPTWYPTKQVHHKHVPTWNYETVHAICKAEIFDDAERLRDAVSKLTDRHEAQRAVPWDIDQAPPDYIAAQLKGIIGIKLTIVELEGKRKLSQNRVPEDREGVRDALSMSEDPIDNEVSASMTELHNQATVGDR